MTFLHPEYFYLLFLLPLALLWYWFRRKTGHAHLKWAGLSLVPERHSSRVYLLALLPLLRLVALGLLIVALARPQIQGSWEERDTEGIDIVLALDLSSSMYSMDFSPNRIEAAKRVASAFVSAREYDNIGLVAFAGESFTASPLTTDHASLLNRISEMQIGLIEDKTAIGLGIATAVNRLKDSPTASKVIILLTDGSNNAGDISPKLAAQLAHTYGITIHTIGMGSLTGEAPYPEQSFWGDIRVRNIAVDIDEKMMQEVAQETGGQYFRASDDKSLERIYSEIDKLEKTKLRSRHHQTVSEHYWMFVLWGVLALALEFLLRNTLLRTNP